MQDKSYKRYKYNLSDCTVEKLAKIKTKEKLTYNLTFKKLIEAYEQNVHRKVDKRNMPKMPQPTV